MRSIAIFGAVGVLVAGIALPSFAASSTPSTEAAATLQQVAVDDAQSLVVASQATAAPLDRGTYTATTPEEIATKKEEEAAAARAAAAAAAAAASVASTPRPSGINPPDYSMVSPGSGEVRYSLPQGSYYVSRTLGGGHDGADMVAPAGTTVFAAAGGTVRISQNGYGGYGEAIVIDHVIGGKHVSTLYAHMIHGSRGVAPGQTVAPGQAIGQVGNTGRSYGAHLHFEVRIDNTLVEPIGWLAANAG